MIKKTVFVIGGSGYLGSATCQILKDRGYEVFNIDSRTPIINTRGTRAAIDSVEYELIFRNKPDAVIHLSAKNGLQHSKIDPLAYYEMNVSNSLKILQYAKDAGIKNFVFGSSGAIYAEDKKNPYIHSKIVFEEMLKISAEIYGIDYAILRYFNIAGADPDLRFGRDLTKSQYIIPDMCQKILDNETITVYTGYKCAGFTDLDGSSIRDYIHINDAAKATVDAAEHLMSGMGSFETGVGTCIGTSTLQLIAAFEKELQQPVKYKIVQTIPTDPGVIINYRDYECSHFDWRPEHPLEDIIKHEMAWIKETRKKND